MPSSQPAESGFTLLETLIALVVLAIAMTGVFSQLRSHTLASINMQERSAANNWLNQHLLQIQNASTTISDAPQVVSDISQRYTWVLTSRPYSIKGASLEGVVLTLHNDQHRVATLAGYQYVAD